MGKGKKKRESKAAAEEKESKQRAAEAEPELKKSKKPKEVAVFGNYRNYYGYRISQDVEEDPRFKVLKKEWFEDKDCLDIGCNSGLITINIAKKFHCRSILGIDIDSDRIGDAYWLLRKTVRMESAVKKRSKTPELETVDRGNDQELNVASSSNGEIKQISRNCSSKEKELSDIVSFRQENFVKSWRPLSEKQYDTIICFSVTKWVHLNWGDDGLISLFSKSWKLLRPGGIFLLEPQPWTSYGKNRRVSELTNINYNNIMFYPESFQDLLLDKIGFRTVENVSTSLWGSKTGFNRPVLAFQK